MCKERRFYKASDVFMGTIIIAELMTAELNDEVFSRKILHRTKRGDVDFSPDLIDNNYKMFFNILKKGLSNDPSQRPDAKKMLELLLKLK